MGFLSKNTEVVFHFLLQWATFCQNSPPYPISLGCPYTGMAHSFIELYKAVVHVINLISFLVPNWERSTSRLYIGHLLTWGVHLSVSYLFAFSHCSWGSQGRNTKVICHSLLQWTRFCQNCPRWPVCLGWP